MGERRNRHQPGLGAGAGGGYRSRGGNQARADPGRVARRHEGAGGRRALWRVTYHGKLYKCLQTHKPQADQTPDKVASLWAEVLPGQDGTKVGEWKQPGSTNGYAKGDKVTHNGKTWVSNVDSNVWEPGATGVSQWDEVK